MRVKCYQVLALSLLRPNFSTTGPAAGPPSLQAPRRSGGEGATSNPFSHTTKTTMPTSTISHLAEKQCRIEEDGIRIQLIKLDVEPESDDQWKVSCFLDDNPLRMKHLPTLRGARMHQFRMLSFFREHADTYREVAAERGWLYVIRRSIE